MQSIKMEEEIDLPLLKASEPCLVCARPTTKLHLQVQICYGCAAFYRRSINANKKYKCKRMEQKCDLTNHSRPLCRLCRFNKCQTLSLSINQSKPSTICYEINYIPNTSDPCNIPEILHIVNSMFKQIPSDLPFISTTAATYFSQSIINFIDATKPRNDQWILCKADEQSINIRHQFFNNFIINTAKLLASCPSFRLLSINEKLLIHDRFWQKLLFLRNAFLSCEYYGNETEIKVIIDNNQYLNPEVSAKFFQIDKSLEGSQRFIIPMLKVFNLAFAEFKKFRPTLEEFNYICLISLWSFHSLPQLSEKTQKMGDEIIAEASAKLHEYYIKDLRIQNYASRQAQLFKFANMFEQTVERKIEMLQAWKIFNFGRHAFPYCKFETNYFYYKPVL